MLWACRPASLASPCPESDQPRFAYPGRLYQREHRSSRVPDATSDEGRGPVFVPVEIEGPVGTPAAPIISDTPSPAPLVPAPIIEIVMPAVTVRVPTGVDVATLATVLATLRALA